MPPTRKVTVTGPDIDRLAEGIYGPVVKSLANTVQQLTDTNLTLKANTKKLRKELRAVTNSRDSLRRDLAVSRENKAKLQYQNARLRAQLLNHGINPLEES